MTIPFNIYLCGPTLYDQIHIGNARSLVIFDVIAEYHRRTGGVKYARNITDVDDKILALSGDMHPGDWVTKHTLPGFIADQKSLGIKPPDSEPRASNYIGQMVDMVLQMRDRGAVEERDDGFYFDPSKVPGYGVLSNRTTATPFAVWKKSAPDEYGWQNELGWGRPGWHTECAAMIDWVFGKPVDLHGGGVDLIFPHHENENIQHKCLHNTSIAKNWLHVGTVLMDGQKMAKSVGNILTVRDLANDWSPETLRVALLMSNHSKPIDMTITRLKEAEQTAIRRPESVFDPYTEWTDRQMELLANGYQTRVAS